MASCKCGASVAFVQVGHSASSDLEMAVAESLVPLERYETTEGPRYVVTDFQSLPWIAEAVDPTSNRVGHADHRESCPYQ